MRITNEVLQVFLQTNFHAIDKLLVLLLLLQIKAAVLLLQLPLLLLLVMVVMVLCWCAECVVEFVSVLCQLSDKRHQVCSFLFNSITFFVIERSKEAFRPWNQPYLVMKDMKIRKRTGINKLTLTTSCWPFKLSASLMTSHYRKSSL